MSRRDFFFADGFYHFDTRQEMLDFIASDEYEAMPYDLAYDEHEERMGQNNDENHPPVLKEKFRKEREDKRNERRLKREKEGKFLTPPKSSKVGMCFVIEVTENISDREFEKKGEAPKLDVNLWFEARDGMSNSDNLVKAKSQQNLPSLQYAAYDRYV